jgi:hypothetical protein
MSCQPSVRLGRDAILLFLFFLLLPPEAADGEPMKPAGLIQRPHGSLCAAGGTSNDDDFVQQRRRLLQLRDDDHDNKNVPLRCCPATTVDPSPVAGIFKARELDATI